MNYRISSVISVVMSQANTDADYACNLNNNNKTVDKDWMLKKKIMHLLQGVTKIIHPVCTFTLTCYRYLSKARITY